MTLLPGQDQEKRRLGELRRGAWPHKRLSPKGVKNELVHHGRRLTKSVMAV